MAGLWPRTGNVTVTNGSKIVTGFGTKWKTGTLPIQKGHTFYGPDNFAYEVDTVVSDESLTLVEAYRGGTLANQGYRIDITRTSTISQFAADLASLVAKYRAWFDGMMTWLTGSGDVAILNPDTGANVTIPSWKKVASEGEGQTARAKVEADRAKTEADRAFTEADRAAGIVAAAALPLPDVWAPLSDSLRLITGYGREVKVGDDVVARMVNFSRSTTKTYQGKDGLQKTAAINEATFGIGGCLVDGQSTNVVPFYDNFSSYTSKPTVTTPESDGFTVFDLDQVAYKGSASSLTVGAIYTISALVDVSGPCVMRIGFGGQNRDVTISAAMRGVISLSANCASNDGALCRIGPTSRAAGVRVRVRYLQLEALPFASSPIPTNGAAVTRAADAIQIPYAGNGVPLSDMQMTMSAVIKVKARPGENTAIIDAIDAPPFIGVFLTTEGRVDLRIFDVGWTTGISLDMTKEQVVAFSFDGSTGRLAVRVGDKVFTGTVVVPNGISRSAGNIGLLCRSGTDTRTGFGSVRDFKIWHKFFTVDQLRAIK